MSKSEQILPHVTLHTPPGLQCSRDVCVSWLSKVFRCQGCELLIRWTAHAVHRGCSGTVAPSSVPSAFLTKPRQSSSCCWPGLLRRFCSLWRLHNRHTHATDFYTAFLKTEFHILVVLRKFARMTVFNGKTIKNAWWVKCTDES